MASCQTVLNCLTALQCVLIEVCSDFRNGVLEAVERLRNTISPLVGQAFLPVSPDKHFWTIIFHTVFLR